MYSSESSHRGDSNEYTQHAIIAYKIERISLNNRNLVPDIAPSMARITNIQNKFPWSQRFSIHWRFIATVCCVLPLIVPHLFLYRRLEKPVLRNRGLSWVTSIISFFFIIFILFYYYFFFIFLFLFFIFYYLFIFYLFIFFFLISCTPCPFWEKKTYSKCK